MLSISKTLSHYKREDIRKAIAEEAKDKEIAVKFQDKFGKRPDILQYPNDILEFAKQRATSFHASEELWKNPLQISTLLKKDQMSELRKGWDLVLDMDCEDWEFSKLTTHLFIKALKRHNIKSVSCKFSGNKGFHIAVPFEAFPNEVSGKKTKDLFPDGPRKIAEYLLNFISENYVKVKENIVSFDNGPSLGVKELKERFGKKEFILNLCKTCGNKVKLNRQKTNDHICSKCGKTVRNEKEHMVCDKCKILMTTIKEEKHLCNKCKTSDYVSKFDPLSIIEVDTILISSRHLYRMEYSFHEKSGLVSIPINPNRVLDFYKDIAKPENFKMSRYKFLDRSKAKRTEGRNLMIQAFDFNPKEHDEVNIKTERKFEIPEDAVPESFFPPCIKKGLLGLEDGKKRFMFILCNFLRNLGWGHAEIEKFIKDWNKKNKEQLRETLIVGHSRYGKQQKKRILPPNCSNQMYYKDMHLCSPDNLCQKIKNPVQYATRKSFGLNNKKKKAKK